MDEVPPEYRSNFIHLYLDIGWYAVLAGSSINFQNVYATRLGASGFQIGLMAAIPALVSLLLAIPAGLWLEKSRVDKAVFWTSVLYRAGFLFWAFLPWFFNESGQVWSLTTIILLQAIPLTALAVGFTALFAAATPPEWRAQVAGTRNVVLSIAFMVTSLACGWLLEQLPFPLGYQVVFGIGFFGAAMSSLHLYFVRPLAEETPAAGAPETTPVLEKPAPRPGGWRAALRGDILAGPFRKTLLVFLFFHLTQYLAIPIFPLYFVRELQLTDEHIGIGTAFFYLTTLIGSTQLARITNWLKSHRAVTGWGVMGMSLYPLMLAASHTVPAYYLISILGGFIWALVGGAYANYILDHVPANDRPAHLAWYNVVLNASVLVGSLAGPLIADQFGLAAGLVLAGILRGVAGLVILKFG